MNRKCPEKNCPAPEFVIRDGYFRRKDDSKLIQRFRCKTCGKRFSAATFSDFYLQKKRRIHFPLLELLSSGVSMRRAALLLGVHRKTVERKLPLIAERCRRKNSMMLNKLRGRIHNIQIDDLITKENSKLKPLSVTVVVDEDRRLLLSAEVSQIPSFGHLAKISVSKYGKRKDRHFEGLTRTFQNVSPYLSAEVQVKSDEHQAYPGFISAYLPRAKHLSFKSERSCVAGQGELKKVQFDPLFIVNHTCAMLRANINRLIRKTWCTTKDPNRLKDHLDIFMYYLNHVVLAKSVTPL